MAKPKTIHTLDSLFALTTEEGECRLWNKYLGNGVPMIYHDGQFIQVRKLILMLQGIDIRTRYISPKCNNPLCVEPSHIVQRTAQQQHSHMAKMVSQSPSNQMRIAKITKARRQQVGKLNQEQAIEIRMSDESGPVLAARYGVSRELVNRIKRGESWSQQFGNPFAALFAANDSGRKRA